MYGVTFPSAKKMNSEENTVAFVPGFLKSPFDFIETRMVLAVDTLGEVVKTHSFLS